VQFFCAYQIKDITTGNINIDEYYKLHVQKSIMIKINRSKDKYRTFTNDYTNVFNFIKKFDNDGCLLCEYNQL
jgi:hypothetical protein